MKKKFFTAVLASAIFFSTAAHAAWEFDEKTIVAYELLNTVNIKNQHIMIERFKVRYDGHNMDMMITGTEYIYFDLYGKRISPDEANSNSDDTRENDEIAVYKDGIAKACDDSGYLYYIDNNGENIFNRKFKYGLERIDNNEFVAIDADSAIILTAKGIIGEALYSDIKININGVEIPCRSVYGYAGVVAEDLRSFGFDVIWDEEARLLSITRNPEYYKITPAVFEERGTPGTHFANIYGTDINVEYNGKRISSYCIDGRTLIKIEDLVASGITFNYDNSVRTLFMNVDGLEMRD